jgi:hypothetical protein
LKEAFEKGQTLVGVLEKLRSKIPWRAGEILKWVTSVFVSPKFLIFF